MHTLIEKYMDRAFKLVSKRERETNPSLRRREEQMKKTVLALKETTIGRKGVIGNRSEGGRGSVEGCANE